MGRNYTVLRSRSFIEKLNKMLDEFIRQVENIEIHLRINPYVGKPLGVRWKREKKIGGKRVYYIIYEIEKKVELLDISGKKDQQKIIDRLKQIYITFMNI